MAKAMSLIPVSMVSDGRVPGLGSWSRREGGVVRSVLFMGANTAPWQSCA